MYAQQIEKIIKAINIGRTDLAQFYLSDLLLTTRGELIPAAKKELEEALEGSKVVYGDAGSGLRAGYLLHEGERYYFA